MALRDQPYLPLYVQDFMSDEKLCECSAAATGIYIRLMCLMHKSEQYGKIYYNKRDNKTENKALDFAQKLSKQMPFSVEEIYDGLCELIDLKIIQISGEKLIQKRMVRDGELSDKRAKSGKKGMSNRWKSEEIGKEISYNKNNNKTDNENVTNAENENENEIKDKKGVIGEKEKKNLNFEKRKEKFKLSISEHLATYGKEMCNDFYSYWAELNRSGTKMRFEMQDTWEVGRRLATWAKNDKNFHGDGKTKLHAEQQKEATVTDY